MIEKDILAGHSERSDVLEKYNENLFRKWLETFMIQKLREATELLTENSILLSLIVMTVWLPGTILLVYLRLYVFPESLGGDEYRIFVQEFRIATAIELAFGPFYIGAIIHALSQLKQGLKATYSESMSYAARKSFKLLSTRVVTNLIVFVGLIALIIPGIILSLRFALIDAIVVLEGKTGASARNLSTELTQGKRWNILGSMILAFLGVIIAILVIANIAYLPLAFIGQDENFFLAVIVECISTILLVIPMNVLFLYYWDAKQQQAAIQ